MPFSTALIRKLETVEPQLKEVLLAILEEVERNREESVTKKEFLAFAEKTENSFQKVWKAIEELVEAQKRTEKRVEELAEAQKRTEVRIEELVEAQRQTELEIKKLAKGLRETRQMVGGLSDTVGYGLEDRAIAALPGLLKKRFGIEPDDGFVRKFIVMDGKEVELNMFGAGHKDGEKWFIVGEGKAKLSKKDIDKFLRLLTRLETAKIVGDHVLPLMVTYSIRPATEDYAKEKGINIIWSYELKS